VSVARALLDAKLWAAHRAGQLLAELDRGQGQRTDLLPATVAGGSPYQQELEADGKAA
jgi:hypothetical protein